VRSARVDEDNIREAKQIEWTEENSAKIHSDPYYRLEDTLEYRKHHSKKLSPELKKRA
jgi:hypothetical protein